MGGLSVAIALTAVFALADIANADAVYLGTGSENAAKWGSAWSGALLKSYTAGENGTFENPGTGAWKVRHDALTGYLTELGNQEMSTEGTSVNSASDNTTDKAKLEAARRGVLSTKSHEVKYFKAKEGGNGTVDKNSIYGRQADSYAKGSLEGQSGYDQLIREGSNAQAMDSSAASNSVMEAQNAEAHTWNYDAATDTWSGNKKSGKTLDDHGMGIFAFITSFTYDSTTTQDYVNGWFSTLGNLTDVLINGKSLFATDFYWQGADQNSSKWFASYDFELDLAGLLGLGFISEGNNNISFVIDSIPVETVLGIADFTDNNDALIGFAADFWKTDESIFFNVNGDDDYIDVADGGDNGGNGNGGNGDMSAATPEPATMLIFGLGLAGLGLVRRRRK